MQAPVQATPPAGPYPVGPPQQMPAEPLPEPHVVKPPATTARRIALVLSCIAVVFSLSFGFTMRRALRIATETSSNEFLPWYIGALVLLAIALLIRMGAAVCEILWLERTWSNLPEEVRKVGPFDKVSSMMALGLSFVPGVAWLWKLGLIRGVASGFEHVRKTIPFKAPVPRKLGMAAIILGWIPGLNVYLAPFLWEIFAIKIDRVCDEIMALKNQAPPPS
jgi:hypothetical protein